MLKYVSIISFLIILSVRCSLRGKGWDYTSVWFSSVEFGIPNNCNGDVYSKRIEIYTDSKRPVKIHAISKSSDDLQVFHDSSKVSIDNEFILNSKQPITLDVQIKINPKTQFEQHYIKIRSDHYSAKNEKIFFKPKSYVVSVFQIKNKEDIMIDMSNNCLDSISVKFPIGGTITSVAFYSADDSLKLMNPYKSISYMTGDDRTLSFSKKDIGKYLVDFSSCHWGTSFFLELR